MSAPTALYRRYRPDSFADVIGQEHVTAPLMTALDKNRVNHAYLFSGPRGCGKTTSARILARCLNCAQGPTSHPCGSCDSCIELARGGPGSLDVIEIDAASHGGVDDARDLRERATFAPIRDRYKIFIIDEAHMVTSAGFNALLKIVEEPPEHIKFIFATTEPDKVIGTIRSRTHHYPFRLVPPEPLMAYLARLCEQENVPVAPGVLSLVIRAGGGSVRDSLSVLDQLMAGAGAAGLDYELAVDLLGYTHASLLDDVVEALAAADSATVFKSVDRVIQTGHDPRRFVEDLLERFRDLIIVQAMPESAHAILRGTPDELIARMQTQAAQLGAAELSRAADVTNSAFNEMTGATSPRLHLELLGARLLLPGADASARGMAARLDAMERRLNYGAAPATTTPATTSASPEVAPAQSATATPQFPAATVPANQGGGLAAVRAQLAKAKEAAGAQVASRHKTDAAQVPAVAAVADTAPAMEPAPQPAASAAQQAVEQDWGIPTSSATANAPQETSAPATTSAPSWDDLPTAAPTWDDLPAVPPAKAETTQPPAPVQAPVPEQPTQPAPSAQPRAAEPAATPVAQTTPPQASAGSSGIEVIRRAWPEILGNLGNIRKASWAMVNQNVVPRAFDGQILRVALPTTALIQTFENGGHADNLRQAIHTTLGISCELDPITGDAPSTGTSAEPNPKGLTDPRSLNPERGNPTPVPATAPIPTRAQDAPAALAQAAEPPATPSTAPVAPAPDAVPVPAAIATQVPPVSAAPNEAAPVVAAPSPAPRVTPASEWTGPIPDEPSWDEEPPHDDWAPEPAQYATAPEPVQAASQAPEPVQEAAPYRPKVSPISAWTTGWDMPAEPAVPVAAAADATAQPRRSQLLAQQAQQSANEPETVESDAPQDWGVSLGAVSRNRVADPGWGAVSNAPDWAQPATPAPETASDASAAGSSVVASQPQAPTPEAVQTGVPERNVQPVAQEESTSGIQPAQQGDSGASGAKMSMYQRLSNSPEAQAGRVQAPAKAADTPYIEDVPSPDDVTIEESGVVGQAAVERILGGALIEERPLNGNS
ncbi:DNA polymerase III subunit gamma and tau [Arthrobacter sp. GMC3]|uniref:DNA polymerase III subunit gamma and tau n=1 Tax=Arthrobacter sp. GMC3 TaxID=2058894 RepID=UPI000CE4CEAC|nr:DNA polymerase III subunit gamma and tau [Arthrobacter sp. GMC3]